MNGIPQNVLEEFFNSFNNLIQDGLNIQEIFNRVEGPALLIIPIAIYR